MDPGSNLDLRVHLRSAPPPRRPSRRPRPASPAPKDLDWIHLLLERARFRLDADPEWPFRAPDPPTE